MFNDSWFIAIGAALVLGIGGIANWRARRETLANGQSELSLPTRVLMVTAFGGMSITILLAAFDRALPLDVGPTATLILRIVGTLAAALGGLLIIAVFASRKRTWDVDTEHLATGGAYAVSRNPRAVGWTAIYLGLGLFAGSGAVIALAAVYLLGYTPWIVLEEQVLARRFGDEYRAYCLRTRRFL